MKGFPKYIATKQDFINLLEMPEFKAQALVQLENIHSAADDYMTVVVSGSEEEGNLITEEIPAPNPAWKQKGFESRDAVMQLIKEYGG